MIFGETSGTFSTGFLPWGFQACAVSVGPHGTIIFDHDHPSNN
jgi:hypothetical protein